MRGECACPSPAGSPLLITLVHGTFGRLPWREAKWTRPGSHLRRMLQAELGDVEFSVFRWSGLNSPGARHRAAERLAAHVEAMSSAHPERRHMLVAHSHGGNVALYALGGGGRQLKLDGLVCLSTPFVVAQLRPATPLRFVSTYAVLLVALFALAANLLGLILPPLIATVVPGDVFLVALARNEIWLEFAACAVLAWVATRRLVRVAEWRERRLAHAAGDLPIAIFRSIGDEASALLATSSFLAWLVVNIWRLASGLTMLVACVLALIVFSPLALALLAALAIERILVPNGPVRRAFSRMLKSTPLIAAFAAVGVLTGYALWGYLLHDTSLGTAEQTYGWAVAGFFAIVVLLSSLSGLGYGLTTPFLEVTAESTPIGSWQIQLFAPSGPSRGTGPADQRASRLERRRGLLSHSAAYRDPTILEAVAHWIRAQSDRAATDGGDEASRLSAAHSVRTGVHAAEVVSFINN